MLKPESPLGKAMQQLIEERNQARAANEDMAERLAAAQARIVGLESDLAIGRECNAGLVADNKIASMEIALARKTIEEQKAQGSAMQARIGALETVLEEAREALPNLYSYRNASIADGIRSVIRARNTAWRLGQEMYDLLGSPNTPEGKALRALVRAASPVVVERMHCSPEEIQRELDWVNRDPALQAGLLAVLLARREQERRTCGACKRLVENGWCERRNDDKGELHVMVDANAAPPDDCPGFEPREVKP